MDNNKILEVANNVNNTNTNINNAHNNENAAEIARANSTNTYKFGVTGKQRKALVTAIGEILGVLPKYLGTPSYGYTVGDYHIDRDGVLTGEFNLSLFAALADKGFESEVEIEPETTDEANVGYLDKPAKIIDIITDVDIDAIEIHENLINTGVTAIIPETAADPDTPMMESKDADAGNSNNDVINIASGTNDGDIDTITIEIPLDGFSPETITNLQRMTIAKEPLIKMALGVDSLPIRILEDRTAFDWFNASHSDNIKAYSQFIEALCETAKRKKRVLERVRADEQGERDASVEFPNPRFSMRTWLTSLGMVGGEYSQIRHLLVSGLEGDGAYRYGKPESGGVYGEGEGANAVYGKARPSRKRNTVPREVVSIRFTLDILEKLNILAAQAEAKTGYRTSRNMLIEQVVEAYVAERFVGEVVLAEAEILSDGGDTEHSPETPNDANSPEIAKNTEADSGVTDMSDLDVADIKANIPAQASEPNELATFAESANEMPNNSDEPENAAKVALEDEVITSAETAE